MMTERRRLANRRSSETFDIESQGLQFTATVSRFADGRARGNFPENHKAGSMAGIDAADASVVFNRAAIRSPARNHPARADAQFTRPRLRAAGGCAGQARWRAMSRANSKQQRFAPLPLRALRDPRLGRLHLCTLGIVAAFDRLGKNGSGCWASQNTIAEIAAVDKTRLSHSLSDLRDYGYISSEINPHRRWFRVHRVIYTDEDLRFWKEAKSVAPHDNCLDK